MKTTLFLFLFIPLFFVSCNQQKSAQHEGAWKLVYSKSISADTVDYLFPGKMTGSDMKIWTKNHFIFVGKLKLDTTVTDSYGGGTYKLEGNRYEENILYHCFPNFVGNKVNMLLEVKNDTLFQTWPVKEDGTIDKSNYIIEKYIRAE